MQLPLEGIRQSVQNGMTLEDSLHPWLRAGVILAIICKLSVGIPQDSVELAIYYQ